MKSCVKAMLAAAGLSLLGATGIAAAQEFSLLSAPFGTGSYVMGSALEQVVNNNHASIRVSHSESPGFVFNHKKLDAEPGIRKTMFVGSGRGVNAAAAKGQVPFEKETTRVLLLANYNVGGYWLATLDPGIKSIRDLKGKTVATGRRTQINWTIQPEALLRVGHGLGESVRIEYLGVKEGLAALLDGRVDAAVVGAYFDPTTNDMQLAPATIEFLAAGRKVYFLDWGREAIEKVDASGMPLTTITLPAGSVEGQTEPLEISGDTISWMAHEEFPEQAAYEITKLIIGNLDAFAKAHSLGKLMSPKALTFGWSEEEIHPGALRAYREAGLLH